jgi:hypothetical protein
MQDPINWLRWVHPMEQRLSKTWWREVQRTGHWFDPPFWRAPTYAEGSPWSVEELDEAFEVLTQCTYPVKAARRMLRDEPRLSHQLLMDFWAPHISELVSLGFDALHAEAWRHKKLLRRLQRDAQFEGARLELSLMAALSRAELPFQFEPLAAGEASNPDFELMLDGTSLFIDAKCAQTSKWREEEQRWINDLSHDLFLEPPKPYPLFRVDTTEEFEKLLRTEQGRSWLRKHMPEIRARLRITLEELAGADTFPVRATLEFPEVGTLVNVHVSGLMGSGGQSMMMGPAIDSERESIRVARNFLEKGASQLPPDRHGALIIDIGRDAGGEHVEQEVRRWFSGEGATHPQLVGVLLIEPAYLGSTFYEMVRPVWRENAPSEVQAENWSKRLEEGLNWKALCVAAWSEQRTAEARSPADADGSGEQRT